MISARVSTTVVLFCLLCVSSAASAKESNAFKLDTLYSSAMCGNLLLSALRIVLPWSFWRAEEGYLYLSHWILTSCQPYTPTRQCHYEANAHFKTLVICKHFLKSNLQN